MNMRNVVSAVMFSLFALGAFAGPALADGRGHHRGHGHERHWDHQRHWDHDHRRGYYYGPRVVYAAPPRVIYTQPRTVYVAPPVMYEPSPSINFIFPLR